MTAATDPANNFFADSTIPNPSVFSLDVGNATFINYFNNTAVGHLYLDNMKLYPGDNVIKVRATIDNSPIITALMTAPVCDAGPSNGILAFELQGECVVNAANETLPYYEAALAAARQHVEINVGEAINVGLGFNPAAKCSS